MIRSKYTDDSQIPWNLQFKIINGQYHCMGVGCNSVLATLSSFQMHKWKSHKGMVRKNFNRVVQDNLQSVPAKYREEYQKMYQ